MKKVILVVEDNPMECEIVIQNLSDTYDTVVAHDGIIALECLQQNKVDLVLLDIIMPNMNGLEFLQAMYEDPELKHIPVIVMTGSDDLQMELKALELGAWDFLPKPFDGKIMLFRIKNALERSKVAAYERFKALSERDSLTGLYNQKTFLEKSRKLIDRNPDKKYVMIFFNFNHFKSINIYYGFNKGDEFLKRIGTGCSEFIGNRGIVCRLVSDKFALLVDYDVGWLRNTLLPKLHELISEFRFPFSITFAVGIYIVNDTTIATGIMLDCASLAQNSIKDKYGQCIAYYDESIDKRERFMLELSGDMVKALEGKQFLVYLQPQYNQLDNTIIGAEALVRWKHPTKGMIRPDDFIPLFERNGFVYALDKYVWEQCCILLKKWLDEGLQPVPLCVNISRVDILDENLCEYFVALVKKYRLPPSLLHLEITESAYSDNPQRIIQFATEMQNAGFYIAMDDFGSGYSSLNILSRMPVDILKLDMAFIHGKHDTDKNGVIISSILRMAQFMRLSVIAEGVETKAQATFLKSVGCSFLQGYLFARPMPVSEYERLMRGTPLTQTFKRSGQEEYEFSALMAPNSVESKLFDTLACASVIFEFYNDKLDVIKINDSYIKLFKMEMANDERLSEYVMNMLGPDKAKLIETVKTAIQTSTPQAVLTRRKLISNQILWIKSEVSLISSHDGHYLLYANLMDITNEVESMDRLRNSSDFMNLLMKYGPVGICIFRYEPSNVTPIYINSRFRTLLGYSSELFERGVPFNYLDVIYPEDYNQLYQCHRECVNSLQPLQCVVRIKRMDDGLRRYISIKVIYVKQQDGSMMLFASLDDVTAVKEREEAFVAKLNNMAVSFPDSIAVFRFNITSDYVELLSRKYDLIEANCKNGGIDNYFINSAKSIIDYANREEYLALFNRKSLMRHYQNGNTSLSNDRSLRLPNGKLIWVTAFIKLYENPVTLDIEAIGYALDSTDKHLTKLTINKMGMRDYDVIAVLDAMNDFAILQITSPNSRFSQRLRATYQLGVDFLLIEGNFTKNEYIRLKESLTQDAVLKGLADTGEYAVYYQFTDKNKNIKYKKAVFSYMDEPKTLIFFMRQDVTEVSNNERQRNQQLSEALENAHKASHVKAEFLSRTSHKIRTPLNAIIGLSEMASLENENTKIKEYLEKINASGTYLLSLINDLLDMDRMERKKFNLRNGTVDISAFFKSICSSIGTLCREKDLALSFEQPKNLRYRYLVFDKIRMQQLIMNIVSNAIKFTAQKGKICIDVSFTKRKAVLWMTCVIKDNGIGMSKEMLAIASQPFEQMQNVLNEHQGMGLGLSISRNIVELMKGKMQIESEEEVGTTVTLQVPLEIPESYSTETKPSGIDNSMFSSKRVLLCEDNQINAHIASSILKNLGFIVEIAENGKIGLEKFINNPDYYYQLIIMDIRMPIMDGFEATTKIRTLDRKDAKDIPIIAMSANALEEDEQRSIEAGMTEHITKPIDTKKLVDTLGRIFCV